MRRTGFLLSALLVSALVGHARQIVSSVDAKEEARFQAIVKAVTAAGYSAAVVVGHGNGPTDAVFALTAMHAGKGVLMAVVEPGRVPSKPIDLESDQTPSNLGVHGVNFRGFLDQPDLIDIEVLHRPFTLEISQTWNQHYIVRRQGGVLTPACDFRGTSQSSSSKGMGSLTAKRTVIVEPVQGGAAGAVLFDLKIVDETIETRANDANEVQTTRRETRKHYELPASGACREVVGG